MSSNHHQATINSKILVSRNFRIRSFRVKKFSDAGVYTDNFWTGNFRVLNFRIFGGIRKYFYTENFCIYGMWSCHFIQGALPDEVSTILEQLPLSNRSLTKLINRNKYPITSNIGAPKNISSAGGRLIIESINYILLGTGTLCFSHYPKFYSWIPMIDAHHSTEKQSSISRIFIFLLESDCVGARNWSKCSQ